MSSENSKNTDIIVNTAVRLFKEKGYENVSVQEICSEAGVSRSSFYAIFSGKSDIVVSMIDDVGLDFEKMLPSFIRAESDLARIWLISKTYLSIAVEYGPQLLKALFIEELSGAHKMLLEVEKYSEWLIPLVRNCQKNGSIQNFGTPEDIVKLQFDIAKGSVLDWILADGSFDLTERIRQQFITLWCVDAETAKQLDNIEPVV